jgi:hypothetical protein
VKLGTCTPKCPVRQEIVINGAPSTDERFSEVVPEAIFTSQLGVAGRGMAGDRSDC